MPRSTRTVVKSTAANEVKALREEFAKALIEIDALRTAVTTLSTKLDADAGVTAADFVTTVNAPVAATAQAKTVTVS